MLAAAALASSGCGGSSSDAGKAKSTPTPGVSPTLALTDCDEWREMRQSTRRGFVTQMNIYFGGQADNGYGRGQTLSDEQAFRVIAQGCKPRWAGAVKLYKLYGRAAAFTPSG